MQTTKINDLTLKRSAIKIKIKKTLKRSAPTQ